MRLCTSWIEISKVQHVEREVTDHQVWCKREGIEMGLGRQLGGRITKAGIPHHPRVEERGTVDSGSVDSRIMPFVNMNGSPLRIDIQSRIHGSQAFHRT